MTEARKELTQYVLACVTLASGIIMCFLSFFMNNYEIHDSALWYFGETATLAGALMGITQYVNTTVKKAEMRMTHRIDRRMKEENRGEEIDENQQMED